MPAVLPVSPSKPIQGHPAPPHRITEWRRHREKVRLSQELCNTKGEVVALKGRLEELKSLLERREMTLKENYTLISKLMVENELLRGKVTSELDDALGLGK